MFMPRTLANTIDQIARKSVGKDWTLYAALLNHWQEIVGQDYARVATPVKITFPHQPQEPKRCSGTLFVRLPKGLVMEFTFKSDQIKQRINGYFGYDAITRINLEGVYATAPVAAASDQPLDPDALATIEKTAKEIDNPELQAVLESFGKAILKSAKAS